MSPSIMMPLPKEVSNISVIDNGVEVGSMEEEFIEKNWIIIPKIDLFEEIFEGGEEVLSLGVYHKFPEMGDPEKVGNFLLTAHRQELGLTVDSTRRKSPFYNIDKLEVDDEIKIVWNHVMYIYVVKNIYVVEPDQMEIEKQTEKSRLTLYTCTLAGSDDGRIVIEAFPK
ncbi:class E sortase [bacterium]|nr:class E sortase [bacterium]